MNAADSSAGSGRRRSDRTRRRLAWAAPVLVAGAIAAGVVVSATASSGAAPNLAPRTVKQLLTAVQSADTAAFSGQIHESANLGLPSLPGDQSAASLSWQLFVTGSHNARVWADGPDKQRAALVGELSEADVVHNGRDLWTYTSDTNTVTHTVLPLRARPGEHKAGEHNKPTSVTGSKAVELTPGAVAGRVLSAVTPSTSVTVGGTTRVAGHDAYTLVVRPRDTRSTVREVTIAIDSATSVPLRVKLFGTGSSPAFQLEFSSITFGKPAASIFAFHAPAGATTSTDPLGVRTQRRHRDDSGSALTPKPGTAAGAPKLIGSGWTSVVEFTGGLPAGVGGGLLDKMTTSAGTSGQRLLHTALVNAVLLPDGRAFLGAVSPKFLEDVAAHTAR